MLWFGTRCPEAMTVSGPGVGAPGVEVGAAPPQAAKNKNRLRVKERIADILFMVVLLLLHGYS
jgi:hypothetical protein